MFLKKRKKKNKLTLKKEEDKGSGNLIFLGVKDLELEALRISEFDKVENFLDKVWGGDSEFFKGEASFFLGGGDSLALGGGDSLTLGGDSLRKFNSQKDPEDALLRVFKLGSPITSSLIDPEEEREGLFFNNSVWVDCDFGTFFFLGFAPFWTRASSIGCSLESAKT